MHQEPDENTVESLHFVLLILNTFVALQAASLTVDSCSEDQEPGYCTVSNVAVATDW